jgi:hypothetical protein
VSKRIDSLTGHLSTIQNRLFYGRPGPATASVLLLLLVELLASCAFACIFKSSACEINILSLSIHLSQHIQFIVPLALSFVHFIHASSMLLV